MRYLIALTVLLLTSSSSAHAQGALSCNQSSLIHVVGAVTSTQLIPATTNQRVGLCGYTMIASAMAASLQLTTGTGTNCGTGTANLSPMIILPVGGVLVNRSDNIAERTPGSNAVCYVSTGQTGTMDAVVYWTYF